MSKIIFRPLIPLLLLVVFACNSLSAQDLRVSYDLKPTNDPLKDTLRIYFQSAQLLGLRISEINLSYVYDGACSAIQGVPQNIFSTELGAFGEFMQFSVNISKTYSGYVYNKRMQYGNTGFFFGFPIGTNYTNIPAVTAPNPRMMMQFELLGACNEEAYIEHETENALNQIAFFDSSLVPMRNVFFTYVIVPIVILESSQFDFGLYHSQNHSAKLSWQVEGKWDFVELERSAYPDFREKYILTQQNGSLDNSTISGQYEDFPPASQRNWYYRLRHIDLDGRTSYSQVENFKHDQLQARVWPNPIQDQFFVQTPQAADLRLLDINGRVLATTSTDAWKKGTFHTQNLSPGIYFVEINTLKNGQRQVIQLVK